jgi:hypothetical protein
VQRVGLSLRQQFDATIAEAYSWPADLLKAKLLARLVQFNHHRQQEEAASQVRCLRPAYQVPGTVATQSALPLLSATPTASTTASTDLLLRPADLAPQVRVVMQSTNQPPLPR